MKNEEKKELSPLESVLTYWIKLYQFSNQKNPRKKYNLKVAAAIKESLNDPKAKVANRLSLSRIPLGLAIPVAAKFTKNQWLLLLMTTYYALSDGMDGFYSKYVIHHPTEGGRYLDAICDKIGAMELIASAIPLKNPELLVNGILEAVIGKTNTENTKKGIDVHSTKLGKTKMWPLSAALICTYMANTGFKFKNFKISKKEFKTAAHILIPVSAALEIANAIQYSKMGQNEENYKHKTSNTEIKKAKTKVLKKTDKK